jgi:hypothetical protein
MMFAARSNSITFTLCMTRLNTSDWLPLRHASEAQYAFLERGLWCAFFIRPFRTMMKLPHCEIKMITTMQSFKRFFPKITIGIIAVAIIAVAAILLTPSPSPAQPVITWAPESVSEMVVAGETKTVSVSFTAAQNLGAVDVLVVPELASYVTTNPTSFANITAGQVVNLDITIAVPAGAMPKVVDGTIQIRNPGRPPRNFARPLPVAVTISVRDAGLPPDPGEAGTATLEGIDSDNDGVRDDIQRYIALSYPESERIRAALTQYARTMQASLLDAHSEEMTVRHSHNLQRAIECLYYIRPDNANGVSGKLQAQILNTNERSRAWIIADKHLGGQVFFISDDFKSSCDFNPDALEN